MVAWSPPIHRNTSALKSHIHPQHSFCVIKLNKVEESVMPEQSTATFKTSWERVVRGGELAESIRVARLQEVVLVIRLISIRFVLSWERKACWLIRFTFYSHAHWGIRDKSLFRLVHYKRSGGWQPHIVVKTRQIHRIHGIGDHGSVAFSFLNLPLTHQTDHPEFWPVFYAIVLTHNYVSTAVLPSPRCAPFAFSAGP